MSCVGGSAKHLHHGYRCGDVAHYKAHGQKRRAVTSGVSPLREVSALLPRRWRQVSTQTVSLSSRSLTRALFLLL